MIDTEFQEHKQNTVNEVKTKLSREKFYFNPRKMKNESGVFYITTYISNFRIIPAAMSVLQNMGRCLATQLITPQESCFISVIAGGLM